MDNKNKQDNKKPTTFQQQSKPPPKQQSYNMQLTYYNSNKKYENAKTPLQLLDEQGEMVTNKEGVRIEPGDIKDIDDLDKARHIKGHIYKLKDNKVEYVKTLAKEKEILELAEKKDSKLKKLVEEYMADFKEEVL